MAPLYLALLICFLSYAAEKDEKAGRLHYTVVEDRRDPEELVAIDPARPYEVGSRKELDRLKKLSVGDTSAN
jgi:hypothetical protein